MMPSRLSRARTIRRIQRSGLFFSLSLTLTLLGILTRPIESLSLFWPCNAILLGILLRKPYLARWYSWIAIYLGMLTGDFITGRGIATSAWINLGNMSLITTVWYLLAFRAREPLRLDRPSAMLRLFSTSAAGAVVAATLACINGTQWFDDTLRTTWLSWFSEQFSTSVLLLPVLLSVPRHRYLLRLRWAHLTSNDPAPVVFLLLSLLAASLIGGPGALAFPVPALLWCALRYPMFIVALLTLLVGIVEVIMVANNVLHFGLRPGADSFESLVSARLGIAMLALGPLIAASMLTANRRLLARLERQANHDFLTGALARRALTQRATRLLERRLQTAGRPPMAFLMIDIDHFKSINDRHGHAIGDSVLQTFSRYLHDALRSNELFGRLGGEEFVVVLPGIDGAQAMRIAERLRHEIAALTFPRQEAADLRITVSIGVSSLPPGAPHTTLERMLSAADLALYQAKRQGRNRVVHATTLHASERSQAAEP